MDVVTLGNLCGAQRARNLATLAGGNDEPVINAISVAINTAINSGLFTCTASMSGYSAQNIQAWMNMLTGLSYTVSLSGTTLTVSW